MSNEENRQQLELLKEKEEHLRALRANMNYHERKREERGIIHWDD